MDVRDLQHAGLAELHGVAKARNADPDDAVGKVEGLKVHLARADGFEQHPVEAETGEHGAAVDNRRDEAVKGSARRQAAHVDVRVAGGSVGADAVAEHGAAREGARRIDRQDGDALPPSAQ